ncbi:MAG: ion transporter [Lysobacterales bacterium]
MTAGQTQAASLFEPFFHPARPDGWRFRAYRILFHHERRGERWFDIGLIIAIMISVLIAILDSMQLWHSRYHAAFRVLQLVRYQSEASMLISALRRSRRKILLFVSVVVTLATVFGALMYLVEGPENGFNSIPHSIYWAIVTMATVGFGDITPHTALGQFITTLIIIIGYGIIAVPTGIYAAELVQGPAPTQAANRDSPSPCPRCGEPEHVARPRYCHRCGERLDATSAN